MTVRVAKPEFNLREKLTELESHNCDEARIGELVTNVVVFAVITVAELPSASASVGSRYIVDDSTVAGSGNFGATVAGGGSNVVPVYSDGTNWKIG